MKIKTIEHVYVVDGTEKEVREYANELRTQYKEVSVYATPYDDRIICSRPHKQEHVASCPANCPACEDINN